MLGVVEAPLLGAMVMILLDTVVKASLDAGLTKLLGVVVVMVTLVGFGLLWSSNITSLTTFVLFSLLIIFDLLLEDSSRAIPLDLASSIVHISPDFMFLM